MALSNLTVEARETAGPFDEPPRKIVRQETVTGLLPGEFVFLGTETGRQGKHEIDLGYRPIYSFEVAPLGRNAEVTCRFRWMEIVNTQFGRRQPLEVYLEAVHRPTGVRATLLDYRTDVTVEPIGKFPARNRMDEERAEGRRGEPVTDARIQAIPYSVAAGEAYSLVVVQCRSKETLLRIIPVARSFAAFRLENCPRLGKELVERWRELDEQAQKGADAGR